MTDPPGTLRGATAAPPPQDRRRQPGQVVLTGPATVPRRRSDRYHGLPGAGNGRFDPLRRPKSTI